MTATPNSTRSIDTAVSPSSAAGDTSVPEIAVASQTTPGSLAERWNVPGWSAGAPVRIAVEALGTVAPPDQSRLFAHGGSAVLTSRTRSFAQHVV